MRDERASRSAPQSPERAASAPGGGAWLLHTAAAAAATWGSSTSARSPEPPLLRSASPALPTPAGGSRSRSSRPASRASPLRQQPAGAGTAPAEQLQQAALLPDEGQSPPASCSGWPCPPPWQPQQQDGAADEQDEADAAASFQAGVRHAGWLYKRFGRGHKAQWRRLWAYLVDDRLCYCEAESVATALSRTGALAGGSSSPGLGSGGGGGLSASGLGASTAASLAALTAGEVRYVALDRIPVRPLPHRQHERAPSERSHPDVGVALIDARVLPSQPPASAGGGSPTVFSLVAGHHTHYLAADTPREAQLWVSLIREAWLHCFSHTARRTGGGGAAAGVAASQRLLAENALLRESIGELRQRITHTNGEYWRKWVEEKARNQALESQLLNAASYEVLVRTGAMKGAGSDARVYLELFGPGCGALLPPAAAAAAAGVGAAGASASVSAAGTDAGGGEVRLLDADSPAKPFQRGACDAFSVACLNVGLPTRLRVWHDNTGCQPAWFLVDVRVRKAGARDWVTFPCNRWLSTEADDGAICRVLTAGSGRPQLSYRVVLATSDRAGAGTDASVWLQLHGVLGDGVQQPLRGGPTAFDRAASDEFVLQDADLGQLTAVTVGHDGSGVSPAWHLDHVAVTPVGSTGCAPGGAAQCPSPSGSSAAGSCGGPEPGSSRPSTASSPHARASSSALQLQSAASRSRGCSSPVGQARWLGPAGSASAAAGGASAATAADAAAFFFPCGAWLDETLGDGATTRRLPVASCPAKAWYTLHVSTSDLRGAGTGADVHVALTGSAGSSGVVALPSRPGQFQRGQVDTFRLQLPQLGALLKLCIGTTGAGEAPDWHLALVEVLDEAGAAAYFFAADRWLGPEAGVREVTLTASREDPRQALREYEVCFITSPLRGAGTDSSVTFELRGARGSTGAIAVAAGRDSFQRGTSCSFAYVRPHLGELLSLAVWHDNGGAAAPSGAGAWHLEAVVVRCAPDGQLVTFPCGAWLSAEAGLRVELRPGKPAGLARYLFEVVTGSQRGAGTDGALTLELCGGPSCTAGPWCLDRPGAFGRGQTDSFEVEGPAVLPAPSSLRVQLESASPLGCQWHLSHIVCTVLGPAAGREQASASRSYYFAADRCLDAADGSASVVLQAAAKPPPQPDAGLVAYSVRVFTSPLRGAGTDAAVRLNLVGSRASSGWQELPARRHAFEQGQVDEFVLKLPDLGVLSQLGVRSDGSGGRPSWHLDKICVAAAPAQAAKGTGSGSHGTQAAPPSIGRAASLSASRAAALAAAAAASGGLAAEGSSGSLPATAEGAASRGRAAAGTGTAAGRAAWFVAQRWLDAQAGLEVWLDAEAADPATALVAYSVVALTSSLRNAGTDCRVFVQLLGERGPGPPRELCGPQHAAAAAFQRGCEDSFVLQLPALGALRLARVWLEGPGRPWHLELLAVTDAAGTQAFFPCNAWLGGHSEAGSSGAPGSAASPLELPASTTDPRQQRREYKVVTRTSDMPGAGSDAEVHVELLDSAGASSGRHVLAPSGCAPGAASFAVGSVDAFSISCPPLGELARLNIGHDGAGAHPAWHLLQVEVTDTAAGHTWFFPADCWLDAARGDGATERLLAASASNPFATPRSYKVTVVTSKRAGARTEQGVHVTLHGSLGTPVTSTTAAAPGLPHTAGSGSCSGGSGSSSTAWRSSGRQQLRPPGGGRALFEAGSVCSFLLPPLQNLGQLRQLTLELDASGGAAWHCQHIEVQDCSSGETWLFPCNTWLAAPGAKPAGLGTAAAAARCEPLRHLAPAASLDAMQRQQQAEAEAEQAAAAEAAEQFHVVVHTSPLSVFRPVPGLALTLCAAGGVCAGPFQLATAPAGQAQLAPGGCDTLDVTVAPRISPLTRLMVACEAAPGAAWHLEGVSVTAQLSGATQWFNAGRWFDAAAGWGAALEASACDVRHQFAAYKVTTHTSDRPGAGTSAAVHVELLGSAASSGAQELSRPWPDGGASSPGGAFGRGHASSFGLRCRRLGELQQLTVWHDASGAAPAWHLAFIEVQEMGSGQAWSFPCGQWLDARRGDGATRRMLLPRAGFDAAAFAAAQLAHYRVRLVTGDVRGAGTDAAVHLTIHGAQGDTGRLGLRDAEPAAGGGGGAPRAEPAAPAPAASPRRFQRGSADELLLVGPDVGQMSHVVVGHDSSGASPAWLLSLLEVQHLGTGQLLRFAADRWLGGQRAGGVECELQPDAPQQQPQQQPSAAGAASIPWELTIITGKVLGAGTDADVSVELHGTAGSFGPHTLPAGPDAFQAGSRDTFRLSTPAIGELLSLVIGHNNAGQGPAWFLQGVELAQLASGQRWAWARVASWLDVASGLSRCLKASLASKPPPGGQFGASHAGGEAVAAAASCSYQLEVQTSDVDGAGTSAAMFVQLAGARGEADAVQLQPAAGSPGAAAVSAGARRLFQRGCADVFILRGMPDVGAFTHLTIGHDGGGDDPGWHLSWVRAVNLSTGARGLFVAGQWLDARRPGGQDWVTLPAAPDDEALRGPQYARPGQLAPGSRGQAAGAGEAVLRLKGWLHASHLGQPGYAVTFSTSNVFCAGTSSRVFFELIGEHGSSGVVYVSGSARGGAFARGRREALLYPRLPYLGQLHALRVGSDGSGWLAAWHLRCVEVLHVHSGQRWLFECHDWIDRRNGWQLLLNPDPAAPRA